MERGRLRVRVADCSVRFAWRELRRLWRALALAALAGAISGLLLGRHIDAGHGGKAVWYAFGTLAGIIVLRAVATDNAALAILAGLKWKSAPMSFPPRARAH